MRIVHQQWQLVGQVLIVDDDGNALVIGKDAQGNDARVGTVAIAVARFRGNEFEAAYQKAREACAEILVKLTSPVPLALVPGDDLVENENEALGGVV